MKLDEVNEYGREALRQMMFRYPDRIQQKASQVHRSTLRVLERDALVQVRYYHDNEFYPPRRTRKSHETWEAWLTSKGVNVALMLGYRPHTEEQCMVPAVCELHTPLLENRIKPPSIGTPFCQTCKDWHRPDKEHTP